MTYFSRNDILTLLEDYGTFLEKEGYLDTDYRVEDNALDEFINTQPALKLSGMPAVIKPITIAIDFDGTCATHSFPKIGKDIGAQAVLRELVLTGHRLILYTMRSDGKKVRGEGRAGGYKMYEGDLLAQAVRWFALYGIPLYGIQQNPTQASWTKSPKCYANLYIDDAALGIPLKEDLKMSDRPFVDWVKTRELLIQAGILR